MLLYTRDVIHSFWVPQLNKKQDMLPEQTTRLLLYADRPGRYRGQCAEFCGLQHAHMGMYVFADTPAAFRAWLAREAKPATTGATVAQGDRTGRVVTGVAAMATKVRAAVHERVERLERMWVGRPGVLGWLTTTDHKLIGLLYFWTTLVFFGAGGVEALMLRAQLA